LDSTESFLFSVRVIVSEKFSSTFPAMDSAAARMASRRARKQAKPRCISSKLVRSVTCLALLAFSAVGHAPRPEPPGAARPEGFSAPSRPMVSKPKPTIASRSRSRDWRKRYKDFLLSGPPMGRSSLMPRNSFATLGQETILGISLEALAENLQREDWSLQALPVRSLSRVGASKLSAWQTGGLREISFGMVMGIPWQKIEIVEGWTRSSDDVTERGSEAGVGSQDVRGTVRYVVQEESLSVEITFHMSQPILNRMRPRLQLNFAPVHVEGKGQGMKVWFGGHVEWKEKCHFMIRKPMERGFLLGLSRYGLAIMDEIRALGSSPVPEADSEALRLLYAI